MNREEQTIKASVDYNVAKGRLNVIGGDAILSNEEFITFNKNPQFIDGAKWADENPPESFKEALRMEYEKGKNEGYHELIDKACEWLKENKEHPFISCEDPCLSGYLTDEFINDFRKAILKEKVL